LEVEGSIPLQNAAGCLRTYVWGFTYVHGKLLYSENSSCTTKINKRKYLLQGLKWFSLSIYRVVYLVLYWKFALCAFSGLRIFLGGWGDKVAHRLAKLRSVKTFPITLWVRSNVWRPEIFIWHKYLSK
jgi:hypothetical protein